MRYWQARRCSLRQAHPRAGVFGDWLGDWLTPLQLGSVSCPCGFAASEGG
jgi:hypothetical protein